jgi:hypothetical protein
MGASGRTEAGCDGVVGTSLVVASRKYKYKYKYKIYL